MLEPSEILFVGLGSTPVCWYRCALPAMNMGADWCGVRGEPPEITLLTGVIRNDTRLPNFEDYSVVVLQQARGKNWLRLIRKLQAKGVKVLYEIDDYLHGVRHVKTHDWRNHKFFSKKGLEAYEICMRMCDGIIVSTQYLGELYKKFNPNVYVCENGLDVARYNLTRPERSTVNIGWAGATGHLEAIAPWLIGAVVPIMEEHDDVCFVSVGADKPAHAIALTFGADRAISTPFTMIETYPAAMTMIDIALAPMGTSPWHRAKSDLRWLEAGALGIPIIASPHYTEIADGVSGFWAGDPSEARATLQDLVGHPHMREEVGGDAREHVWRYRTAAHASLAWLEVCRAAVGDYQSARLLRV